MAIEDVVADGALQRLKIIAFVGEVPDTISNTHGKFVLVDHDAHAHDGAGGTWEVEVERRVVALREDPLLGDCCEEARAHEGDVRQPEGGLSPSHGAAFYDDPGAWHRRNTKAVAPIEYRDKGPWKLAVDLSGIPERHPDPGASLNRLDVADNALDEHGEAKAVGVKLQEDGLAHLGLEPDSRDESSSRIGDVQEFCGQRGVPGQDRNTQPETQESPNALSGSSGIHTSLACIHHSPSLALPSG